MALLALTAPHAGAVTVGSPEPFFGEGRGALQNGGLDPRLFSDGEAAELAPFHPALAPIRPTRFHPVQARQVRGEALFTVAGVGVPGAALVLVTALGGIVWLGRRQRAEDPD